MRIIASRVERFTGFSRGHGWLPLLNVLVIAVCAGLLYLEHHRDAYSGNEPALGHVIFQMGRTQNKARSQVIFQDLRRNHSVREGDTVRTARAAEVMLQLTGGTRVVLEEFSMVVINRPEKRLRLRYSYGTLRLRKARGVDVTTKGGSILVDRGDVSISRDSGGKTRVLVDSGSVRIRGTAGDERTVRAGNKAVLESDGARIAPMVLAKHSPPDGRRILGRTEKMSVDFDWLFAAGPADAGQAKARFELSSRRDFRGIVLKREDSGGKLSLSLSPGVYYWRVVRGGDVSEIRRLVITRIPEIQPMYPMAGSVFEYLIKRPTINFTWQRHVFAAKYRLEVSRQPDFSRPLHSVETASRSLVLDLEEGDYYWRLRTVGTIPDASIIGAPIRFTVRKTPLPVVAPAAGAEVDVRSIREEGIAFRWKAPAPAGVYELNIARDADFRDIVLRRTTSKTELKVKREFAPGRYYWRLRLTRNNADASSLARELVIRLPLEPPEVVFPRPGAVVDMSARDFLPLRWRRVRDVKRYRLVLRQVSTGRVIFSRIVGGEAFLFKDLVKLDTGKFTWSIASLGKDNRAGRARSTPFTITLQTTPAAPTIKVP